MLLTFSNDSLSPHYDPDDGPVTVSAAYRAEIRAFLLGEPEPLSAVPCPRLASPATSRHDKTDSSLPVAVGTHPTPRYFTIPVEPPIDIESGSETFYLSFEVADVFDPASVLREIVYYWLDFRDCLEIPHSQPDVVYVQLVRPDNVHTGCYVPIDRLPPEHIALIESAHASWDARHANANSPSPLTERGSGDEGLPTVTASFLPDTVLIDLGPYLSDLLTARPHLLEALANLRAARSERARRAAATRRVNRHAIPYPFFASDNSPAPIPPTPSAVFILGTPSQRTSAVAVMACLTRLDSPFPPLAWGAERPGDGQRDWLLRGWGIEGHLGWGMRDLRARPPPAPINVLAVPPGVFAFGTP